MSVCINIVMKFLSLQEYNELQMEEMERHRWIESEKAGYDLGEGAYLDWIQNHSAIFRDEHKHRITLK